MEYINQYDYPHIPYPHPEGVYTDKEPTIALCGCGLCSLWMVIRMLTDEKPSLEDLIQMSVDSGANVSHGTQMRILAPYAAKKYGLQCTLSTDPKVLRGFLEAGNPVIICAAGDTKEGVGLFSHVSHFIVGLSMEDKTVCVLDPAYTPGKFDDPAREGKVRTDKAPFLYVSYEDLVKDSLRNGRIAFSILSRK